MEDWAALVQAAQAGDENAERELAREVAHRLKTGKKLDPMQHDWLTGGLSRRGHGGSWRQAFAPMGRVPPAITAARKQIADLSLVYWVDYALKRLGLTTSKDGEPGPAFERVAKSMGLSAATVRDRYYRAKRRQ